MGAIQYPKSLKDHVRIYQNLPIAVRTQQAIQRRTLAGKKHRDILAISTPSADSSNPPTVTGPQAASASQRSSVKYRLLEKHPRPRAYLVTIPKEVAPCGDWTLQYLHSVREKYVAHRPNRQITLTDLPIPPKPGGWTHACKCWWCLKTFDSNTHLSHHLHHCPQMPYKLWLRRVRILQHTAKDSIFTCPHCGTAFHTPKAKGKHSTTCGERRLREQLSLNGFSYVLDELLEA